jgi:hypothetical protein
MPKHEDVADAYRIALAQLRVAERRVESAEADFRLAAMRYEAARKAWVGLALEGEEDEFLASVVEEG